MFRSCTVQTNLDFSDEQDMVKKMRLGVALQPITTAMFANSPFRDRKPTDFLSWRMHVWQVQQQLHAQALNLRPRQLLSWRKHIWEVLHNNS